ncbi:hypothetical protein [Actinacidiphila oryziradicis]|uniref:hypothetical protein n=1 Tax=Actinacidiphila oryziradicis TaxID=2571141 RepID=UPI001FEB0317|nr:hypothetical protein [Actinacidiphila oryziradicis]
MDLPLVGLHGEALRPDTIWAEAREVDWQRRSIGWSVHGIRNGLRQRSLRRP